MNRSKRALVATAAVLGVSLAGCGTIEALTTPHYNLTGEQRSHMNKTARLGYDGLDGFQDVVKYPSGTGSLRSEYPGRDMQSVPPVKMGEAFKSDESLETVALEVGMPSRDDGDEMRDFDSFTPSRGDGGVYVTYNSTFVNLAGKTKKMMVFRNPDAKLFGEDGQVSVDEMLAFFRSSRTELVSFDYDANDEIWGKCGIKLSFDGDTLITNAADGCKHYVKHTDNEGLLADLEDLWYLDIVHDAE